MKNNGKATDGKTRYGSDLSGATMVVEKVFKGDVRAGEKLRGRTRLSGRVSASADLNLEGKIIVN